MQQTSLIALLLTLLLLPCNADEPNDLLEPKALKNLIQAVGPSIVTIRVSGRDGQQLGIGTGFVIDSKGLIATNFHVITEGRSFSVELLPPCSAGIVSRGIRPH